MKISKSKETKLEKEFIERIGRCEHCGVQNETLIVHHTEKKLSHPEARYDQNKWVVLCVGDHRITEEGGKDRFGRKWEAKEFNDHLKEYLKQKDRGEERIPIDNEQIVCYNEYII